MNIGDIRMEEPTIYMKSGIEVTGPQRCVVVYIHPKRRFYTVEFTSPLGWKFRESYHFSPAEREAGKRGTNNENDCISESKGRGGQIRIRRNIRPMYCR